MDPYDISDIFREMEEYLLASMSRNLKRHTNWEKDEGFNWEMWQTLQLEALNDFRKDNTSYVSNQSFSVANMISEMLEKTNSNAMLMEENKILEAIKNGYKAKKPTKDVSGAFFRINDRKLKALIDETTSSTKKVSTAMLRMTDDEYKKIIYKSQVFANTGTTTVDQAIDMAAKEFLAKGINCVEYAKKKRVNIVSYTEMAIRTADRRAFLQGEGSKRDEWGIHTVLVSQYGACSEICLPLQGKVYIDDVWSGGTKEEAEELGYPLLSEAIGKGLFHPNCKHTLSTYFEGITEMPNPVDVEQTRENSDVVATQRYNERQIRRYKRLETNSIDAKNQEHNRLYRKKWQDKQATLMKEHPEVHRNFKREHVRFTNPLKKSNDISIKSESEKLLKLAKKSEPEITKALSKTVSKHNGFLEGLDFKLKGENSLVRKMTTDLREGNSMDDVSSSMFDLVRYTSVSQPKNLTKHYFNVVDDLSKKGYNVVRVKNTLGDVNSAYRGLNCVVEDPTGYKFELQFHTPQSLQIKEVNHLLYEEQRLDITPLERKIELEKEMTKNVESLEIPKDIDKIVSFNKIKKG